MNSARTAVLACASLLASAGAALAGDVPAAPFSWTGLYLGINGGVSSYAGHAHYGQAPGVAGNFGDPLEKGGLARDFDQNGNSFTGGGQVGYNVQLNGIVVGLETDFKWRSLNDDHSEVFSTFKDELAVESNQRWGGTVRGRLGWAHDTLLIFATGGWAYGQVEHALSQKVVNPAPSRGFRDLASSELKTGWTIGGGVEYAFAPSWTFGLQYLYMDLGSTELAFPTKTINTITYRASNIVFEDVSQEVTARLSYKLGN